MLWAGRSDAQVRIGGGVRVATPRTRVSVVVGRPYYYRPFYYRSYYPYYSAPFYGSYFYGSYFYRPFYWYPYAQAGYGYGGFDGASLRVQVTPNDAEVFIDNYYAGTVDDFDGLFQRLHVEPGAHDITLWREGYRRFVSASTSADRHVQVALHDGPRSAPAKSPSRVRGTAAAAEHAWRTARRPNRFPPRLPAHVAARAHTRLHKAHIRRRAMALNRVAGRFVCSRRNAEVFIDGERWQGAEATNGSSCRWLQAFITSKRAARATGLISRTLRSGGRNVDRQYQSCRGNEEATT
jgi:hypothetical protein